MLKKGILVVVGVLFSFVGVQAQSSSKAEKLLNEVYAQTQSYQNMVIKFNYILRDQAKQIRQKTNGSVALKGDKYRLELMGTTRIFDGKKIYNIVPEDEEINISSYNPQTGNGFSPSAMLSFYRKGYTAQWGPTQNNFGRKVQYIILTPKKQNTGIKKVLLCIDVLTKHISKLVQTLDDNTQVIIEVKSFEANEPLSKNMFTFNKNKYQGYYINRLD